MYSKYQENEETAILANKKSYKIEHLSSNSKEIGRV